MQLIDAYFLQIGMIMSHNLSDCQENLLIQKISHVLITFFQILNGWRLDKYVSQAELRDVENGCKDMMKLFGYIPVADKDFHNLKIPSVEKSINFNL